MFVALKHINYLFFIYTHLCHLTHSIAYWLIDFLIESCLAMYAIIYIKNDKLVKTKVSPATSVRRYSHCKILLKKYPNGLLNRFEINFRILQYQRYWKSLLSSIKYGSKKRKRKERKSKERKKERNKERKGEESTNYQEICLTTNPTHQLLGRELL